MKAADEEEEKGKGPLEVLSHHVLDYLDARRDLFVLSIIETGLNLSSGIVSLAVWGFFGMMILFFIGIGGAISLGTLLNQPALGYFLVAGIFFLIATLTLSIIRSYIRKTLTQSVLKLIRENQPDEENS